MHTEQEDGETASEDGDAEEGEEEPPTPPEPSIYPPLAPGFMRVQQDDGKVCYQHLLTKVVVWSRPYYVPHEQPFETHEVPRPIGKAVAAVQRTQGIKRPQAQALPPAQAPSPATGGRAVGGKAKREEPVRVFHAGCPMFEIDISGKTPVNVLNEFCPKVLRSRS